MHTYWTAYGLAGRGHEVIVVTNADEVEERYRIQLGPEDRGMVQPAFEATGGRVKVFTPERFSPARMRHIPAGNPFVSKLASLATQTIRQYGCELIFAYYYEPYAVAGYLASIWTNRPLVIKHAGSDLERLMQIPDLATTYKEILKAADGVVTTSRHLAGRFMGMGVSPERIYPAVRFGVPAMVFNPQAAPLEADAVLKWGGAQLPAASKGQGRRPDLAKPTIGIYGKVGRVKGSFDLVKALALLKQEGLDFNFLAMTNGPQFDQFKAAIEENDLADRTWLLPFQPPWRVPRFIRTCTAVCFLERGFSIALHGPTVQREILACGTCLVLSAEIANKQPFREDIVDQENMLVVPDPRDQRELAARLRFVIQNPEQARQIGARGHLLARGLEDFGSYSEGVESLFRRITGASETYRSFAELDEIEGQTGGDNGRPADIRQAVLARSTGRVMPWLRFLIGDQFDELMARFCEQQHQVELNEFKVAYEFCRFLESRLQDRHLQSDYPALESILKHQKAWLMASFDQIDESGRPFAGVNRLDQRQVTWEVVNRLHPLKSCYARLERFDYDVTPFFAYDHNGSDGQISQRPVETLVSSLQQKPTSVLFYKAPNLVSHELKMNERAIALLELCDGTRSTAAISEKLARDAGLKSGQERAKLQTNLITGLQQLYDAGIIIFCSDDNSNLGA